MASAAEMNLKDQHGGPAAGQGAPPRRTIIRRPIQLTLAEIIDAALRVTRRSGVAGLMMRSLADELGVAQSAVYRYVEGRDALIELLGNAVLDTVEFPGPEMGDWSERLLRFAEGTYQILREYPGLVPRMLDNPSPASLRIVDYGVGLLREGGFSAEDAYRCFTVLSIQGSGPLLGISGDGTAPPSRQSILPSKASREGYPELAEIGDPTIDVDDIHAFGIRVLIAGFKAMAEQQGRAS